jgi:hypothetical protein
VFLIGRGIEGYKGPRRSRCFLVRGPHPHSPHSFLVFISLLPCQTHLYLLSRRRLLPHPLLPSQPASCRLSWDPVRCQWGPLASRSEWQMGCCLLRTSVLIFCIYLFDTNLQLPKQASAPPASSTMAQSAAQVRVCTASSLMHANYVHKVYHSIFHQLRLVLLARRPPTTHTPLS